MDKKEVATGRYMKKRTFRPKWFKKKVNGRMQRVIVCPVCKGIAQPSECETCKDLGVTTRAMLVASAIEKLTVRLAQVERDVREMKTVLLSVKQDAKYEEDALP